MEAKRIYLQGLNHRVNDREAQPGDCRVLSNLYPTGDINNPSWKAVKDALTYFNDPGSNVYLFSPYVWHRANLPSLLVIGYDYNLQYQSLRTYPIDAHGNLIMTGMEVLINFSYYHRNRRFRFAQIGDALIISVVELEEPKELYLIIADGLQTVMHPFNIPSAPIISAVSSDICATAKVGWYGYRWALILLDGSVIRPSPVRLYRSLEKRKYIFNLDYTAPADGLDWNKVVRGLGLFISERVVDAGEVVPDSPLRVLSETRFHLAHIFEHFFNKIDSFTFENYDEQLFIGGLAGVMREDNLSAHKVFFTEVKSYNKILLGGGVKYDFLHPARMNFVPTEGIVYYQALPVYAPAYSIERLVDKDIQFRWTVNLSWTNPDGVESIKIEVWKLLKVWWINNRGIPEAWWPYSGWRYGGVTYSGPTTTQQSFNLTIIPDFTGGMAVPDNYNYILFLRVKITANYPGGRSNAMEFEAKREAAKGS